MANKTTCNEKTALNFQTETRFTWDYISWWKDLKQTMFKIFRFCKFNKFELYLYF